MTAQRSQRAVRRMQIGFLVLLLACTAQLVYWLADEWRYTATVQARRLAEYDAQTRWSTELLRSGVPWAQIAAADSQMQLGPDRVPRVSAAALAQLDAERFHRLNRYAWEGAFFLAVLLAAMAVVYAALRRENLLRGRQEEFLAAASHELKSPLASLRLSVETIAMRDPPAPRRERLGSPPSPFEWFARGPTSLYRASRYRAKPPAVFACFSIDVSRLVAASTTSTSGRSLSMTVMPSRTSRLSWMMATVITLGLVDDTPRSPSARSPLRST